MTVDQMRKTLMSRLNKNRFAHSIGVANTAVDLAKRFGVDTDKAYIAGLLHDCAREFENEQLPVEAAKRRIPIIDVEYAVPLLLHAPVGAVMANEIYGVDDPDIIQSIERHTVADKNMSALDMIIYFADMVEPHRNYPGVEELRRLAKEATLEQMFIEGLNQSIAFVISKGSLVHPKTIDARNWFLLHQV